MASMLVSPDTLHLLTLTPNTIDAHREHVHVLHNIGQTLTVKTAKVIAHSTDEAEEFMSALDPALFYAHLDSPIPNSNAPHPKSVRNLAKIVLPANLAPFAAKNAVINAICAYCECNENGGNPRFVIDRASICMESGKGTCFSDADSDGGIESEGCESQESHECTGNPSYLAAYRALEWGVECGLVREIGVCNTDYRSLELICNTAVVKPTYALIPTCWRRHALPLIRKAEKMGVRVLLDSHQHLGELCPSLSLTDVYTRYYHLPRGAHVEPEWVMRVNSVDVERHVMVEKQFVTRTCVVA